MSQEEKIPMDEMLSVDLSVRPDASDSTMPDEREGK